MVARVSALDSSEADHYPGLTDAGRDMLAFMREHPAAPFFRNRSGHRLLPHEVKELRAFEKATRQAAMTWRPGAEPAWLANHLDQAFHDVPFYRKLGSPPQHLGDIPTISRADLAHDITQFVPDHVELERMIHFRTTGTTGHPLLIASHPVVAGRYLAYHRRAMDRFGIDLTHGRGQVGVILLGCQRRCFTYVCNDPAVPAQLMPLI